MHVCAYVLVCARACMCVCACACMHMRQIECSFMPGSPPALALRKHSGDTVGNSLLGDMPSCLWRCCSKTHSTQGADKSLSDRSRPCGPQRSVRGEPAGLECTCPGQGAQPQPGVAWQQCLPGAVKGRQTLFLNCTLSNLLTTHTAVSVHVGSQLKRAHLRPGGGQLDCSPLVFSTAATHPDTVERIIRLL